MKIINYAAVWGANQMTLTDNVRAYIADGWQPYGAPFSYENAVVQAMVKYEADFDRPLTELFAFDDTGRRTRTIPVRRE